jgi:hypothetical protein
MRQFAGILQALEDSGKLSRFSYKEEVAGSNPASPTLKKRYFAGKTGCMRKGPSMSQGFCAATVQQRGYSLRGCANRQ